MVTEAINHDPAHTFMNTGTTISGRPAMGSWINYGLGSESDDLPGFVVLTSTGQFGQAQPIATRQWHSGLLAQPVPGRPVLLQGRPGPLPGPAQGTTRRPPARRRRRRPRHSIRCENDAVDDPEIATRIAAYETAFRMQTSVPELIDLSQRAAARPGAVRHRGRATARSRPTACWPAGWPSAGSGSSSSTIATGTITASIKEHVEGTAAEVDQGAAALDQGPEAARDARRHAGRSGAASSAAPRWPRATAATTTSRASRSGWPAAASRAGITHGATDEFGYAAVHDVVHVHDLHATILALFGIDHLRLVYRFQGRDFRLTDVAGQVVKPILA